MGRDAPIVKPTSHDDEAACGRHAEHDALFVAHDQHRVARPAQRLEPDPPRDGGDRQPDEARNDARPEPDATDDVQASGRMPKPALEI